MIRGYGIRIKIVVKETCYHPILMPYRKAVSQIRLGVPMGVGIKLTLPNRLRKNESRLAMFVELYP